MLPPKTVTNYARQDRKTIILSPFPFRYCSQLFKFPRIVLRLLRFRRNAEQVEVPDWYTAETVPAHSRGASPVDQPPLLPSADVNFEVLHGSASLMACHDTQNFLHVRPDHSLLISACFGDDTGARVPLPRPVHRGCRYFFLLFSYSPVFSYLFLPHSLLLPPSSPLLLLLHLLLTLRRSFFSQSASPSLRVPRLAPPYLVLLLLLHPPFFVPPLFTTNGSLLSTLLLLSSNSFDHVCATVSGILAAAIAVALHGTFQGAPCICILRFAFYGLHFGTSSMFSRKIPLQSLSNELPSSLRVTSEECFISISCSCLVMV